MLEAEIQQHSDEAQISKSARTDIRGPVSRLGDVEGAALLEFAISLPLLVVFVVGIYDFSGAFNQKQKINQVAQEGAILAAAQPTSDIAVTGSSNPLSLQPVVTAIFNSLAAGGVLPSANQGSCKLPVVASGQAGLTWTYTISGCFGSFIDDNLAITINRGWVSSIPGPPLAVGSKVTISYPYHWRFNSVIQLLIPGANYSATTLLTESATAPNQL